MQTPAPQTKSLPKVIVHLDLDCFYAQVEHIRLNIPRHVPLGVQQWNSLIAVNYPAKACGVKRGMPAKVAKEICPDIVCVHVEVIGRGSNEKDLTPDQSKHKASLKRYREASRQVMQVIETTYPKASFERASIDEAYLDLGHYVESEMDILYDIVTEYLGRGREFEGKESILVHDSKIEKYNWVVNCLSSKEGKYLRDLIKTKKNCLNSAISDNHKSNLVFQRIDKEKSISLEQLKSLTDFFLLIGSCLVYDIRKAITGKTMLTISAGIANTKFLAKEISAKRKPNSQTVIYSEDLQSVLNEIKLTSARGLRGKLGSFVSSALPQEIQTLGDLINISQTQLNKMFTNHLKKVTDYGLEIGSLDIERLAQWIHALSKGEFYDQVKPVSKVKSMLAVKSFPPQKSWIELQYWVDVLCEELADRLDAEYTMTHRIPKTLVIHQTGGFPVSQQRTRSAQTPLEEHPLSVKTLSDFMVSHLKTKIKHNELFPCNRLGIAATQLFPISSNTLDKHFSKKDHQEPSTPSISPSRCRRTSFRLKKRKRHPALSVERCVRVGS